MKKLAALRQHLLESVLKIDAENLETFADAGSVESYEGDTQSFTLTYEANLILIKYTGDPIPLYLIILEWLKIHNPTSLEGGLRFDVDILDEEKVDLGFQVELSEDWLVEEQAGGRSITLAPEPVFDPDSLTGYRDASVD